MTNATSVYPYGGIPVFRDFFGVDFSITHSINFGGLLTSFKNNFNQSSILLAVLFFKG